MEDNKVRNKKGNFKRKKYIKPNERQKLAFKIFLENRGKMSMGEVMRQAGYSETSSQAPTSLTNTRGWQILLNRHLSEDFLANKHKYLLDGRRKEETQVRALDMAYKLRGSYAPTESKNLNVNVKADASKLEEYKDIRNQFEDELRKRVENNEK